jgi:hypothetical protein
MQVRLPTITITEQDRRAIRFQNDKRKTMATRNECQEWLLRAIDVALADLRYRWNGSSTPAAVLAGADPAAYNAATQAPAQPVDAPPVSSEAKDAQPQPVGGD